MARHHWAVAGKTIGDPDYNVDADLNRDGIVNVTDQNLVGPTPRAALRSGFISNPDPTTGPDNPIGYAGYVFNQETLLYMVRFRTYDPEVGRWVERDPLGYVGGINLYGYADSSPVVLIDPMGQMPEWLADAILFCTFGSGYNYLDCLGDCINAWDRLVDELTLALLALNTVPPLVTRDKWDFLPLRGKAKGGTKGQIGAV